MKKILLFIILVLNVITAQNLFSKQRDSSTDLVEFEARTTTKTLTIGKDRTNQSQIYDVLLKKYSSQLSYLYECDCISYFKRDHSTLKRRLSLRDVVDQKSIEYLKNKSKKPIHLVFWGSGQLLNELTVVLHLLENNVDFHIDLFDPLYELYSDKENKEKIKKTVHNWFRSKKIDTNLKNTNPYLFRQQSWMEYIFSLFNGGRKNNLLKTIYAHNKSLDIFQKILCNQGYDKKISVLWDPKQLKSKHYDAAFALDCFVSHPSRLNKQLSSSLYFLLHKYDHYGNAVDDSIASACLEIWKQKTTSCEVEQLFKPLYKETWSKKVMYTEFGEEKKNIAYEQEVKSFSYKYL